MYRIRVLWAVAGLALLVYEPPLRAADPPARKADVKKPGPPRFLRIQRSDKGEPIALETAVVRFVPTSGKGDITVDLIGAVHVGDADYYRALNRKMTQYDALLYELVARSVRARPRILLIGNDLGADERFDLCGKAVVLMGHRHGNSGRLAFDHL